ncbi:uncharacterized protein [Centruroides vittatus]|uniref:uncharacterized protein n=1 Tax=Centruroides vittatus TaxID=120091 RepID=UPI0035105EDC
MDHRLSWDQHVAYITRRTGLVMQSFAQVARNHWGLSGEAMSVIYDYIYVPMISYACGSWGWAADKVHTMRKLVSSQRKALLLISRAYRTAPNPSIQVLAKRPPIDLAIIRKIKMQHAKWGMDVQTNIGTISASDIEVPYCFSDIPTHDFHYKLRLTDTHTAKIIVYTDGSKMAENVGCGFVAYEDNTELHHQCYRLDKQCSVFQAELKSIKMAILWTAENYNNTSVHIFTDCLSAVSLIGSNSLHRIACEIKELVCTSVNDYSLSWTRAHQGTVGNKRANLLAKAATTDDTTPVLYNKISKRSLRSLLWRDCLSAWQDFWNRHRHCSTYGFIPDLQRFLTYQWFTPGHQISQLITNHGKFATYFCRFMNSDNSFCPVCGVVDGNFHYIFECVTLEKERLELQLLLQNSAHDRSWPCPFSDLLSNRSVFQAFQ